MVGLTVIATLVAPAVGLLEDTVGEVNTVVVNVLSDATARGFPATSVTPVVALNVKPVLCAKLTVGSIVTVFPSPDNVTVAA